MRGAYETTRRGILVVLACLAMGGQTARGQTAAGHFDFITGNKLYDECRNGGDPATWRQGVTRSETIVQWGLCYGYITGAADALEGSTVAIPRAWRWGK
jgi:hypothetical protein